MTDATQIAYKLMILDYEGKPRAASDLAFDFFDAGFEAGRFSECDAAIRAIRNADLSDTVMVAVLAATYPAREKLPSRAAFVEIVYGRLIASEGKAEADVILKAYQ